MNKKAPDALYGPITVDDENAENATITIPVAEWNAHRDRVESLVNLINGIINGLANNPMFMAMVPPDVLEHMRGTV